MLVMQQARGHTQADLPGIDHWIDGTARHPAKAKDFGLVYDPALGEVIRRVAFSDPEMVRSAVAVAARAFPAWAATPAPRRAAILFRYRELVLQHRNKLACLITQENGKMLAEAKAELDRGIQVIEFACGIPHLMKGEFMTNIASGLDSYDIHEPLGVCVGITPFNFPAMVPMWMYPIAIATGNSFVLKPSEKDPSCAVRLAALFEEAGLPPGVMNVVHGTQETVSNLITNADVAAVSFVGSTSVARAVYRKAADAGKRVQCLGGAKNHLVIMPDADIEVTCKALAGAAYGCAGERCMAVSVAVAVGAAADDFIAAMAEHVRNLTVGSGDCDDTEVGPLITAEHRKRVMSYLDAGIREGARLVVDGRDHPLTHSEHGFFLGPSLFDKVRTDMKIYCDEIFGPVLCVMRATNLEEAIAMMNGHQYANGASIFTRNGAAARKFVNNAKAGMVGINVPIPAPTAFFGFGGHQQSLFGPLHVHGKDGVRFYTRAKTVTSRWPNGDMGKDVSSGF